MAQVDVINTCLNLFCRSSGQKVNIDKTWVYFSRNVHWNIRTQISNALGFSRTDDLGKYLGVPLCHGRVNRQKFQYVIDRAYQRLSQWKSKNLSFAERVTLTKSVLSALPSYVMQSTLLPKSFAMSLTKPVGGSFVESKRANGRCIWLPGVTFASQSAVGAWGFAMPLR